MKYLKWAIGVVVLAIVPVLAWTSVADAQRFSNYIDENQTVSGSLYSSGKLVEIKGKVHGDIFCAGQKVVIEAEVDGDVICAGQDVTIAGKVDGDVRVAGQNVAIEAEVTRSVTVASQTFSLDVGAKVGRDITATGDNLNVKGSVGRDVVATGNVVVLNGVVGRNVKADSAQVRLKENARVAGNLSYASGQDAQLDRGANVAGKTTRENREPNKPGISWSFRLGLYLFILFGLLFLGIVLAYLFPKFLYKTSSQIKKSFVKVFLTGLVASFLIPALAFALIYSIVGIPLTAVLFVACLFAAALSTPVVGFYVGRLVLRKSTNPILIILAGGAIVITTWFLPFTGIMFLMLTYWLGFGALLLTLKDQVRPGYKPSKTE